MSNDTRGRVIPDSFVDAIIENQDRYNAWRLIVGPLPPPRPLTWRQRIRARWYEFKWAAHDRIFGAHEDYDE